MKYLTQSQNRIFFLILVFFLIIVILQLNWYIYIITRVILNFFLFKR